MLDKVFEFKTGGAIDPENYTISFVAISNKPILREGLSGKYYVSIDTSAINFNAKRFYLDHNKSFKNAIGKIIESKLDGEGNIKVKVQFFKDLKDSNEAFLKYKNGLSDSVSIGFGECEFEEGKEINSLPHYKITGGEVIELSAVWEGADPNAKLTKFEKKERSMQENKNNKGDNNMSNEVLEIIELAKSAGKEAQGLEAIKNGTSLSEFSKSLIEQSKITQAQNVITKKDELCFSLANYAKSVMSGKSEGDIEFAYGNNGYIIPNEFFNRFDKSVTKDNQGIIPTHLRADRFIEGVIAESNILGMCDILSGLSGNVDIPKDDSQISAYWVKEGEATTESKITTSKITLTPSTIKAKIKVSRQMMGMSALALESYIINSIKTAIKNKLENDLLYGEGNDASPIKGLFNASGVQSITDYFTKPDYAKTLEFAGKIADSNLNLDNTCFLANSKAMTKLQTTPLDAQSTNNYLLNQTRDYLAGYRFYMNNLVKDNNIIFGDFKNLIVGTWGSLQVLATRDEEGDLTFTGFYDIAAGIKREKAFVIAKA